MSSVQDSEPVVQSRSDMRSAKISLIIAAVVIAGYYAIHAWIGRDSAQVAEEVPAVQEAVDRKIRGDEATVRELQGQLAAVRDVLSQRELRSEDIQRLRMRLTDVEKTFGELPSLVEDSRVELDAVATRQARQRAEFVALEALLAKCDHQLAQMAELVRNWESEYEPLLSNDRGRRLAADAEVVSHVETLLAEPLPDGDDVAAWKRELTEVSRPLRDASASGTELRVAEEDRAYLQAFLTRVETANRKLAARGNTMKSLLAKTANLSPASLTLEEAVDTAKQDVLSQQVSEATERRRLALKASVDAQSEAIQEAEEQRIAAVTQLRLAELEAEKVGIVLQRDRTHTQIEAAKAEAAKKQLEAEFKQDEAEIKSLLAPFLADSFTYPVVGNPDEPTTWIVRGGNPAPVSLGRLHSSGALDDSHEGRHRLYYFAGSRDSLRPKGGFPDYTRTGLSNAAIATRISRARELLLKYGPLMVERGMLQK